MNTAPGYEFEHEHERLRTGQAAQPYCAMAERQHCRDALDAARQRMAESLAMLAHELRHPLAPITTGLAVLRLQGLNPAVASQTLEMMERQVSHMARLVEDLLDAGRIATGKLGLEKAPVALGSLVAHAIETSQPFIDAGLHTLSVELVDDALMLDADPARLHQVLVNLLGNAARYTPAGGRIAVSVHREGRQAVISVADNGIGIAPEALAEIFDLFSQVGPGGHSAPGDGLGIGLALVRQIVERHGGVVSGASAGAGRGSTFTVRLPLAENAAAEAPVATAAVQPAVPAGPARGLRILLVDDDVQAARLLARALELKGHGHVVAVASEGAQAVQLARQFKPEVAFLDISLPDMDGCEVAQALRQSQGSQALVLVALTGWSDARSRARASKAGFDHFLAKPVWLASVDALLAGLASAGPLHMPARTALPAPLDASIPEQAVP